MNLLNILIGPVAEIVKDYQANKARKKEIEATLQEKRLEAISKAEDHAQAVRLAYIDKAGWRPGYWTILLSVPVAMCFVPSWAPYALEGFRVLGETPEWFRYFLGIAVSSAFGLTVADKAWEWWKTP